MHVEIFWRALTPEPVRYVDFQAADAAYPLNASELQLSLTQSSRISPAIRNVSKRDTNVCAKGKDPHLVGATRAQR
jgi:hypothetical protein